MLIILCGVGELLSSFYYAALQFTNLGHFCGLVVSRWIPKVYNHWLFIFFFFCRDKRGKISIRTKIWGLLVKLFIVGFKATKKGHEAPVYSYSRALPYLPIPSVVSTCNKLIESLRPVLSPQELAAFSERKDAFLRGPAPKLQRWLQVKRALTTNYVSDWWLQYVYLRGRTSLMINSNYYGLDFADYRPTNDQCSRAANLTWYCLNWCVKLKNETLPATIMSGTV